jgi:hypothetical protein
VGEVTWWLGTALVGPALFVRYKKYLKIPNWLRPPAPKSPRTRRHRIFVRRIAAQIAPHRLPHRKGARFPRPLGR